MSDVPLSDRAKQRLKIAALILRGGGRKPKTLPIDRSRFYEDLLALIAALPLDEQKKLKEHTDFVEAYDNEWERLNKKTAKRTE